TDDLLLQRHAAPPLEGESCFPSCHKSPATHTRSPNWTSHFINSGPFRPRRLPSKISFCGSIRPAATAACGGFRRKKRIFRDAPARLSSTSYARTIGRRQTEYEVSNSTPGRARCERADVDTRRPDHD